ncbi:MAG: SCP2 sterol-binding domain-containing protein [Gammaproteobacteria bacterium]|nr:SCP2 sterol-binding domain-containing protein [Gammaproteobacteria bacterium]MCY4357286.1 SCP2 sterol-binding domain-containing protein [Gammaproteobacteria bacterium]
MNEFLGSVLLKPAERLINSLLLTDHYLLATLASYAGKTVSIKVINSPFVIQVRFEQNGLRLSAIAWYRHDQVPVDASIAGSAVTLAGLLLADQRQQPLVNDKLQIKGDAQLLMEIFTTMKRLDLQWEDLLEPILGDLGTQQLSRAVHSTESWARDSQRRMRDNIDDYLKQEISLLPHRQLFQQHQETLDLLRLQLDRLEARARILREKLD